jgi:hypothetical protein
MAHSRYHPGSTDRDERDSRAGDAVASVVMTIQHPDDDDAEAEEVAEETWEDEGGATELGPQEAPSRQE